MNFFKKLFNKPEVKEEIEPLGAIEIPGLEFSFNLLNPKSDEIEFCEISESVSFWKHPDKDEIWVYRKGTHSGEGLVGLVPDKYVMLIIKHMVVDGEFISEIKNKTKFNLLIYCRLVPLEETANRLNQQNEKLLESIKKPFSPKTEYLFRIDKDYECTITKKTKLAVKFRSLEEYLEGIENISLEIQSVDGQYSFIKQNEIERIIKIIRGFYSGYQWKVQIKDVQAVSIWVLLIPYEAKTKDILPSML